MRHGLAIQKMDLVKQKPKLGLSVMPSDDFRQASQSMFEKNQVEVVEWSFDFSWIAGEIPPWCVDIVNKFSRSNALIGHGVNLSPLSARFSPRQAEWLAKAREEFKARNYTHASEHFGFSEAGPIAHGAPLAVPMTEESLRLGKEMMKRYADATQCPVGLENLAFAFSLDDVKRQGEFIDQLISEVDGFLLLDVHNIYCQLANFNVSALDLLKSYPLSKVREIHISGGTWSESESRTRVAVRRDTHDDSVPQDVFNLAALALKLCPNVAFVIFERLGWTMMEEESQAEFREDFETIAEIVDATYAADAAQECDSADCLTDECSEAMHSSGLQPEKLSASELLLDEASLAEFQDALAELLSSELSQEEILAMLKSEPRFKHHQQYIESFDRDMVAVACELMGKWARRKEQS